MYANRTIVLQARLTANQTEQIDSLIDVVDYYLGLGYSKADIVKLAVSALGGIEPPQQGNMSNMVNEVVDAVRSIPTHDIQGIVERAVFDAMAQTQPQAPHNDNSPNMDEIRAMMQEVQQTTLEEIQKFLLNSTGRVFSTEEIEEATKANAKGSKQILSNRKRRSING